MKVLSFLLVSAFSLVALAEHNHHAAIFLGSTNHHSESHTTTGLEYEYKLSNQWGIGGLVESVATDPSTSVALLLGYFHFNDEIKAFYGLGQESVSGHSETLVRAGLAYDFHVSSFTLSPTVAYDSISDGNSAVVYGVAFGIGF